MINYNIFKIIIDKVAVNKWKKKVKKLNNEYKKIYYIDKNNNPYVRFCKCYYQCEVELFVYIRTQIYISFYTLDKKCGYISQCGYIFKELPKKYYYTSGMNDLEGYK